MTHDEVLEKCDKHREIHEGVGLSDELVRIVTFAYEQGFCRALAQSLAGAQSNAAMQSSADIGRQEASNQAAERQMAGQLQQQELQGEYASRAAEKDKVDTMFGMSQQRLGAANAARDEATKSIIGGVGSIAGAAAGPAAGMMSGAITGG